MSVPNNRFDEDNEENTWREVGRKLGKYAIEKFDFKLSSFLCLREDSNCFYSWSYGDI